MGESFRHNWRRLSNKRAGDADSDDDLLRLADGFTSISGNFVGDGATTVQASGTSLVISSTDVSGVAAATQNLGQVLDEGNTTNGRSVVINSGDQIQFGSTALLTIENDGVIRVSGLLGAENGSPSAPSYSWASNPNTGMYLIGANAFALALNGAIKLQVSSVMDFTSEIVKGNRRQVDNRIVPTFNIGAQDTFTVISNIGAVGTLNYVLPLNPQNGVTYTIFNTEGDEIRVTPSGTNAIVYSGGKMADGEYLSVSGVGSSITLVANGNDDWMAISEVGTLIEETP